jgi:hypothetical protein
MPSGEQECGTLKSIAKYRFAPAIARGGAVNVTLTSHVAPL